MTVITRFAPSPTGYLHIGSLRTVLYNYLFAKKNNGKFMLRIEDTDRTRLVEGSIENMIQVLASVGLIPDEGPNNPGEKGPYFQSERLRIYNKYVDELLKKDKAYYCFCSSQRLTELREEQTALNLPTKYDKKCRYLSQEEINKKLADNIPYTVRLKVPDNTDVTFIDTVRGKVTVNSKDIDDQVLLKTDGFPTYHLANVVDDHLMEITDVIRGEEWTPSTPKHVLLYQAFGWDMPTFTHLPLLLGSDKKKISKRTGDVSVEIYLEKGYLTEALINYIALLGWNPKTTEEFFSMNELIERFNIEHVNKSGAVFDVVRLDFFNSHYLKKMDRDILYNKYITFLKRYDQDFLEVFHSFPEVYNKKILDELKTKMKNFSEFKQLTTYFYGSVKEPSQDLFLNEKMKVVDMGVVKQALCLSRDLLLTQEQDFQSIEEIKNLYVEKINEAGLKNGQVLWPTRVALSGEQFSPGGLEMIYILGIKESIKRIEKILKNI